MTDPSSAGNPRPSQDAEPLDLLIIGGGVNGCGIARDASGRGLRVMLVERDDLAQATSSRSTKLIHGGLRYLEFYDFRLVREALIERERLLRIAPHIIWPLRFVLPHSRDLRPAWLIKVGLFLYDHLGGHISLPHSTGVRFRNGRFGAPLRPQISRGFLYSDAWVQDSRLVVLNARDAAERGADVRTRTRFLSARRERGLWAAEIEDVHTGQRTRVEARGLVNAAGPWVDDVLKERLDVARDKTVRMVKGSHIVVRRLYEGDHAYILQNPDRRIVFTIPYEGEFTLIGTTDIPYEGDPATVAIDQEETEYLLASVNRYFRREVHSSEIVWTYSGVRPLYDDAAENASAVTRDYVLDVEAPAGQAPVLSVFGGKITTYRRLAEHALEKLLPCLPNPSVAWSGPWTDKVPLPGGDIHASGFESFLADLRRQAPFLPEALARRLARAYGTRVSRLLGSARSLADLGENLGGGLTEAELVYLREQEWAQSADDVLWRRSKLGLHLSPDEIGRVRSYFDKEPAPRKLAV